PRGGAGVHRLPALRRGAGRHPRADVHVPGERGDRPARVLDHVRTAGRRPVHGEHRGHQQPPRRVDRAVDADRDRLATVPTARGGRSRGGWLGTAGVVVAAAVPLAFLAVFFAYPVAMLVARGFLTDGAL